MCVINAKTNYIKQRISHTFLKVFFEKAGLSHLMSDYSLKIIGAKSMI